GLVLQHRFGAGSGNLVAINLDCLQGSVARDTTGYLRLRDLYAAMIVGIARLRTNGDRAGEVMLKASRADVHRGIEIVVVLETIVVGTSHRRRLAEVPWQSIVGRIAFALMEVGKRQPARGIDAELRGRRKAIARILGHIARGDVLLMAHHIEAKGRI